MSEPRIYPTADARVRIACHGPRNWRTEVQSEPGASWVVIEMPHFTRAEALLQVPHIVRVYFGEADKASAEVKALQERVHQLTAENAGLAEKLRQEKNRSAALLVDGDRREQRALALLPDCDAHRRELQYLRHCAGEYWHAMNDSDQARRAIVGALGKTVLSLEASPGYTVKAAELAAWLQAAIDKQDKPLKRHVFPNQADCLRSAAGECRHEGICDDVKADIAEALGLVLAAEPARCKPVKAKR